MFDSIKRALPFGGGGGGRLEDLEDELRKLGDAITVREAQLEDRRASRHAALYPQGPIPGSGERFPGLHPWTFEEAEPQPWLVAAATGIIDKFPGGESLLSQLDTTFHAFSEANHYRVRPEGPYAELLTWQREILHVWDLELEVEVFVANGGGSQVLGCRKPFVVLDRMTLDSLPPDEQRFLLATRLAHVFFGNLKIFAFYRLFEMLDKLPSMTSLIARGLGAIPTIGNTIRTSFEVARSLNQQVIRKTNLVVGQRQHVLCDRLATLATEVDVAHRFFGRQALGGASADDEHLRDHLVEQGRQVHERFLRGEVDLAMLSIVGPSANFCALRAHRLAAWNESEAAARVRSGYYVTREGLADFQRTHRSLEDEIALLEGKLVELYRRQSKLQDELLQILARQAAPEGDPDDDDALV